MSTLCQVRRLAVKKLASLQQASGRLHDETVGRSRSKLQPADFPGSENRSGVCGHSVLLSSSFPRFRVTWTLQVRSWMGWTVLEKTTRSGLWWFRFPLWREAREVFSLHLLQLVTGSGKDCSLQLGRSSCFLRVLFHMRKGKAFGPQSGRRCWSLLAGLWRAIAPLKPR